MRWCGREVSGRRLCQNTDRIDDHESSYVAHRLLDVRGDFDLECCFAIALWSTEPHNNGVLKSLFIHIKFEFEGFQFAIDVVITVIDNASLSASLFTMSLKLFKRMKLIHLSYSIIASNF